VPTAEAGVQETLKVDGSFCKDAYTIPTSSREN